MNDVVVNVVHQDVLAPDGPSFTASRRTEGVELLAGRDNWFRPVSVVAGPEGALYVVDMHREVIEHPEWIPDAVEETLDLRAGDDKGRIYRIVPRDGLPMVRPALAAADLPALVEGLADPDKWWRDTVQRLLVERGDAAAAEPLRHVLDDGQDPLARLHALWTLRGLDALQAGDLRRAVRRGPAGVRESAAVLAAEYLDDPDVVPLVTELVGDADARVRMQAVLTLAGTSTRRVREALQWVCKRTRTTNGRATRRWPPSGRTTRRCWRGCSTGIAAGRSPAGRRDYSTPCAISPRWRLPPADRTMSWARPIWPSDRASARNPGPRCSTVSPTVWSGPIRCPTPPRAHPAPFRRCSRPGTPRSCARRCGWFPPPARLISRRWAA